jgi:tetratricopeptide (TPR) repeat protein
MHVMTEDEQPSREELEQLVTEAALLSRVEEYEDAVQIFEANLPHLSSGTDKDKITAAGVFSYYGLCIAALRKQYSDGIKYCELSLKVQPSNPEHYENQAKIHLMARSRARAVDALFEGLGHDPNNKPINKILDEIGRRRDPVISFLPRNNVLNVYFGKRRHEKFERKRQEAKRRQKQQQLAKGRRAAADNRLAQARSRADEKRKKKRRNDR